jgi:hypothetical protein
VTRDAVAGNIQVVGTNLEPWHKMNTDAFEAYRHKHGEAYARVAQTRAFKAASGKDPEVYRTNPNDNLDVDPDKVSYPSVVKSLDNLPEGFTLVEGELKGRPAVDIIYKGKSVAGYYRDNSEPGVIDKYLLDDLNEYLIEKDLAPTTREKGK